MSSANDKLPIHTIHLAFTIIYNDTNYSYITVNIILAKPFDNLKYCYYNTNLFVQQMMF